MSMPLDEVSRKLVDEFGWCVESLGADAVSRAVNLRIIELKLGSAAEYLRLLERPDSDEMKKLSAILTVPETWFFRHPAAFELLFHEARGWRGVVSILSLPCCTGEEPYSIAITLSEALGAAADVKVDAIDVHQGYLDIAAAGVYGRNSFRGEFPKWPGLTAGKYFDTLDDGRRRVADSIRGRVEFKRGNAVELRGLRPGRLYDAVFCRNLFIYFNEGARAATVDALTSIIKPGGLLLLGPGEAGFFPGFERCEYRGAFAFRRLMKEGGLVSEQTDPVTSRRSKLPISSEGFNPSRNTGDGLSAFQGGVTWQVLTEMRPPHKPPRKTRRPGPPPPPPVKKIPVPGDAAGDSLRKALDLADSGDFNAALEACQQALSLDPEDAAALFLQGVVYSAMSRDGQAEECFRKVLYLQPKHGGALMNMALLSEAKGDLPAAKLYRRRINGDGAGSVSARLK